MARAKIRTEDIIDTQVTLAKQADMATASVVYRKTAGTGVPEIQSLTTLKTDLAVWSVSTNNIAVNTTAGAAANTYYVYFTTATLTLTLPTAGGNSNRYTVKCVAGVLTIDGAGAETIDGTATISVAIEDSVDLISNGTEWKVI